jgi:hypothetical protein
MNKEVIMNGLGSPGRVGGTCYCEDCKKIRKNKENIREIEEKLQSQISVIRESVAQSIKRLRKECQETTQHLKKEAAEKIKLIEKGE